jgi:amino acid transporter
VTETSTAQGPGNTTSITNRTATVQLTPASTTTEQSSSSGLPAWGWVLIGLGAVLIGLVMFMLGRHRSSRPSGATDPR